MAATSGRGFAARLGRTRKSGRVSTSPKPGATSMRSTRPFETVSIASPQRSTSWLRDDAVEHRADRAKTRANARVDALDVATRQGDIEPRAALLRRAQRAMVERVPV